MGGGSDSAGPYRPLVEYLRESAQFKHYVRIAKNLRIDPAVLLLERDWRVNAAREAAAYVISDDAEAAQK